MSLRILQNGRVKKQTEFTYRLLSILSFFSSIYTDAEKTCQRLRISVTLAMSFLYRTILLTFLLCEVSLTLQKFSNYNIYISNPLRPTAKAP